MPKRTDGTGSGSGSGPGHVFVVHADLTRLAVDDVLVPTDCRLEVAESWLPLLPRELVAGRGESGERLALEGLRGDQRVLRVLGRDAPRLWLVDTGDAERDLEWLFAGVDAFLDAVAEEPQADWLPGRERRLVGLPAVGTGGGSARGDRGSLIKELLPRLTAAAREHGFDVALVLNSASDHAAAQQVRRSLDLPWSLPEHLRRTSAELAERAGSGELALFLGAGVSAAAGLPLWSELLGDLATEAACSDEEREELRELSSQDAASVLARRLGTERLAGYVAERFCGVPHALAHALLAALPVGEFVTTNYDPLFESAARGAGRGVRVLPADEPAAGAAWLLKLHGDVDRPETVVLTREQYLRFQEDLAALAGVVHALLLTRHVLFVGFSLLDDNVIRIAHQVRAALRHRGGDKRRIGTVLALTDHPVRAQLWAEDLDYVPMSRRGTPTPAAARILEMFLDHLAMCATPATGYLLDPAYAGMLTTDERTLAEALRDLADVARSVRDTPACRELTALLTRLGARDRDDRIEPRDRDDRIEPRDRDDRIEHSDRDDA